MKNFLFAVLLILGYAGLSLAATAEFGSYVDGLSAGTPAATDKIPIVQSGVAKSATIEDVLGTSGVLTEYTEPASNIPICRTGSGTTGGCTYISDDAPAVINGAAHFHLTAAQMKEPRCHVTNFGQSGEVDILLPAAADGLSCLFDVGDAEAAHWGVTSNTGDDIYLIAAAGTVSQCGDQTSAIMVAAQVGQSFACWSFKTGASAYDWKCKAIAIGTSTFECHAAISAP